MLNLQDLTRLLTIPIGALSGFGSALNVKAGVSVIILFTFIGLLLGLATSWVSFKFERRFLDRGRHFFLLLVTPFIWIAIAGLAPALLVLTIYGHR
jgi:hypothetical protein